MEHVVGRKPVRASEKTWSHECARHFAFGLETSGGQEQKWCLKWPPQGASQCGLEAETSASVRKNVVSGIWMPFCFGAGNQCWVIAKVVSPMTSQRASPVCLGARNQCERPKKCGIPSGLPRGIPSVLWCWKPGRGTNKQWSPKWLSQCALEPETNAGV